ncbi:uncharacterized protein SPSK_08041 [Sporothrix schenckii 1099-18]|uniref:CENP-V/GFA domain-containing protein n=2 Tax=Sporothrix schenckii TaxID=29908 RepID=U7Q2Z2_SPOS1|nr:uncharacterized protein SPSK_08041 [Sporothrix schenckii 1099-18]ERT01076.1 hypothetical protein HMPREF1624_02313 [Sporothrix schenckii ATCC 58251]KJR88209.1 hypothetical protein SPSK_08041 [Sporothrix schenckii 1099-18]
MAEPTPTPVPASPAAATGLTGFVITCECGTVRLRTPSTTPMGIAHCHCTNCRHQSGSAFGTSVYFPPTLGFYPLDPSLLEEQGGPVSHFSHPTDSGNTLHCFFCRRCGSRLIHGATLPDGSIRERVSVKGGAIEDPDKLLDWAHAKHVFVRSAVMPLSPTWETYETTPTWPPKETK